MIRKFVPEDLQEVMSIWLETNQKAHDFIASNYWSSHYEMVKETLPRAEVYVFETDEKNVRAAGKIYEEAAADIREHTVRRLTGFIGITGGYIAGIFVKEGEQSRGVGKQLLDHAKKGRRRLTLQVYEKNDRAIHFYQREGFHVRYSDVDENTGEAEFLMEWKEQDINRKNK